MLLDATLGGLPQRPGPGAPLTLVTPAARPTCAAAAEPPAPAAAGIEALVLERLLASDLPPGSLLEAIAGLTVEALQRDSAVACLAPADARGVAARVATGLAVALLQSDLAERITSRLAAEAPFADGWRSCPE